MFVVWAGCVRGLSDIHTRTYIIAPAIKRLGGGMQVRLNSISVAAAARTRIPLSSLLLSPRAPTESPSPSLLRARSRCCSLSTAVAASGVRLDPTARCVVQNPVGPVFGIRKALLLCDWTDERKDSSDISCGCFNSDASRSNDEHGIAASL
ncbi:unnamed protein product [Arctogadus glacialis]